MPPTVSIVMPAYNQAEYIAQAIESVLAQTLANWELFIIDDGSTDQTRTVVARFVDPRIRYIYQENQERSRTRNNGIRLATGPFIAFLDADDFWSPVYLNKQIAVLEKYPDAGLSFTRWYDTDEQGREVRVRGGVIAEYQSSQDFLGVMLFGNRIGTPSCVVARTDCLKAAGLFNPDFSCGEDWDMWLRVVERYSVTAIPEPLTYYRHFNIVLPDRYGRRGFDTAHVRIAEESLNRVANRELSVSSSQIMGRAYWYSAWMRYAVGDVSGGQTRMTQAYDAWPEFFNPPYHDFVESLGYFADELYDLITPLDEALNCINRVFYNLPAWARNLRSLREVTLGQYCGLHVFRSYERRDWAAVRSSILLAVRYRASWLYNRGFVSIAVQAIVPLVRRKAGITP